MSASPPKSKPSADSTGLVTGANSGLGFEAAAQFAAAGYGRVILAARTEAKAQAARTRLVDRVGDDVFETVAFDVAELAETSAAVHELIERGRPIDVLLLNAGLVSGSEPVRTSEGNELTVAASLLGHHVLTTRLLDAGLIADGGRIVISGSEAARDDVPGMSVLDLGGLAAEHFDGDVEAAVAAFIKAGPQIPYKNMDQYATAKLVVAWWAAALARRLPAGTTVNAVSPGSAPGTNMARDQSFVFRRVMMPLLKTVGRALRLAAPVGVAASRYVEATTFGDEVTGEFFASRPKKMTGDLVRVDLPHVRDRASQEAAFAAITDVTAVSSPS